MGNRWGWGTGAPALVAMFGLSAVVVAACGGGSGGPTLSRTTFTQRANTECATLKAASNELRAAQDPGMTGAKVTTFLQRASNKLRLLVRRVGGLVPPDILSGDVDTLLSLLGRYADGLETLGNHVKSDQTFQGALNADAALVNRLNGYATRATNLAAKIGLAACILSA